MNNHKLKRRSDEAKDKIQSVIDDLVSEIEGLEYEKLQLQNNLDAAQEEITDLLNQLKNRVC